RGLRCVSYEGATDQFGHHFKLGGDTFRRRRDRVEGFEVSLQRDRRIESDYLVRSWPDLCPRLRSRGTRPTILHRLPRGHQRSGLHRAAKTSLIATKRHIRHKTHFRKVFFVPYVPFCGYVCLEYILMMRSIVARQTLQKWSVRENIMQSTSGR